MQAKFPYIKNLKWKKKVRKRLIKSAASLSSCFLCPSFSVVSISWVIICGYILLLCWIPCHSSSLMSRKPDDSGLSQHLIMSVNITHSRRGTKEAQRSPPPAVEFFHQLRQLLNSAFSELRTYLFKYFSGVLRKLACLWSGCFRPTGLILAFSI